MSWELARWHLDKCSICGLHVVLCGEDFGVDDGEDTVVYIVVMDFAGDDFLCNLSSIAMYVLVRDSY